MTESLTVENLTSPGADPVDGDWIRETTTRNGVVISVVEHQHHAPPPPPVEPTP